MTEAEIRLVFGMQPQAAVAYFEQKGLMEGWDWQDMLDDAHATAFTVAKTMQMNVLEDIHRALATALREGQTFSQFQDAITPVLQAKGWWGKRDVPNPDTGEIQTVQLGSPYRLNTIYMTNMQSAYMAGRYVAMIDSTDTHPIWEYVAILDSRTRPSHRALNGTLMAADDPAWDSLYPPLDFRCRCRVVARSLASVAGRKVLKPQLETQTVDIGRNEYTGEERFAQRTGIRINGEFVAPSPGFNANQGKAMLSRMASVAVEKAQAAHPDIARVALKTMMGNQRFQAALTAAQLAWVTQLLAGS